MSVTASQPKLMIPYLSRYYFYGSWLFPLFGLLGALVSPLAQPYDVWLVLGTVFLLIVSLHRVSWGKHPRFGAHFTWVALGFSFTVTLTLASWGNWIGALFVAAIIVLNGTTRRRFCRALTRLF